MRILGALLAGGAAKRFGSDKALAKLDGEYLIDHAIKLLEAQCDHMIICGREFRAFDHITDNPIGQGPLGGINAALCYAQKNGFDAVISFPCDTVSIDGGGDRQWFNHELTPQYISKQPVIGFWPTFLAITLNQWLLDQRRRAMMAWVDHIDAKSVDELISFQNINKLADLEGLQKEADKSSLQ